MQMIAIQHLKLTQLQDNNLHAQLAYGKAILDPQPMQILTQSPPPSAALHSQNEL